MMMMLMMIMMMLMMQMLIMLMLMLMLMLMMMLMRRMMRYVEPFSASPEDPKHPMLVLVYRQPGKVELEEFQRGCSPSIVTSRVLDKDDIAAKYNLELVAGTFFLATYSGKATDE